MDLILVDTSHLLYRCHHTFQKFTNKAGEPTGIHFGVMRALEHLKKSHPNAIVVFAYDGSPWLRKEVYPDYKGNRTGEPESHADIIHDFGIRMDITEMVKAAGCAVVHHTDYESDDLIAMMALARNSYLPQVDGDTFIYSGDDDFCQLVRTSTFVIKPPAGKTHPERMVGLSDVRKEWGVEPESLALLRSFYGDSGDNIKGLPRIGRDRLISAVQGKETPEQFYEGDSLAYFNPEWKNKLTAFRGQCEINYRLCRLPWDYLQTLPLVFNEHGLDMSKLQAIFEKYEFSSYLKKMGFLNELLGSTSYGQTVLSQPNRLQSGQSPSPGLENSTP